MYLRYEKPEAEIWLIRPDSAFLSASNEDLPVVPITPFSSKKRDWYDDGDWDD